MWRFAPHGVLFVENEIIKRELDTKSFDQIEIDLVNQRETTNAPEVVPAARFYLRFPTINKNWNSFFTQTIMMLIKKSTRRSGTCVLSPSESTIISLVTYLATLIQPEIGLNGVPKPITQQQSLEIRSFRKNFFRNQKAEKRINCQSYVWVANKMAQAKIRVAFSRKCFFSFSQILS